MKRALYKKSKFDIHVYFMEMSIYPTFKMTNCFNNELTQYLFVISPSRFSSDWDSGIRHHPQAF